MLTKEEYEKLLEEFNINETQIFTQENHYFDTACFSLKELGSALRIREKENDYFELTLKQPESIGLLETTQKVTRAEFNKARQSGQLPKGIIHSRIEKLGLDCSRMEYFGSLLTKRIEFPYKKGLLVLDHSFYLHTEDYEMEYEVENYQLGEQIFDEILDAHHIPKRKTENKVSRFYQQKYCLKNQPD